MFIKSMYTRSMYTRSSHVLLMTCCNFVNVGQTICFSIPSSKQKIENSQSMFNSSSPNCQHNRIALVNISLTISFLSCTMNTKCSSSLLSQVVKEIFARFHDKKYNFAIQYIPTRQLGG